MRFLYTLAFFPFFALPAFSSHAAVPESFAGLVSNLMPAVVNISSSQKAPEKELAQPKAFPDLPPNSPLDQFRDFLDKMNPDNNQGQEDEEGATSLGSGFIVDPSGYVVTNNHVIADAEEITVIMSDDSQYNAKIVGRDLKTDLALLKIDADKRLPYVKFGNSDKAHVGDWVIAIGNPFGLGGSVSAGIISARARDINAGPFDDFIQTDAAINRGNSGGPMFDTDGKVIGINTAIFSPSGGSVGIGFAVPSSLAEPIIRQLREKGEVQRGWLGVKIQDVTKEIAESVGLSNPTGALVVEVNKASPAEKGGIIAGDIILSFNGKKISDMRKLPRFVAETAIGNNAALDVFRLGKMQKLTVNIGQFNDAGERTALLPETREGEPLPEGAKQMLGLTLLPLDEKARSDYGFPSDLSGLLVLDLDATSAAAKQGFQAGDIVTSANQEKIASINDFLKVLTSTKLAGRPSVLVLVSHEGDTRFLALPITNDGR